MALLWQNWMDASIAAITLVFFLVGLAYMVAYGLQLTRLKAWAKNEFYQAVASAVLVAFMLILIPSLNGLTYELAGPCPSNCCKNLGNNLNEGQNCKAESPYDCDKGANFFCVSNCPGYSVAFDHALCFLDETRAGLVTGYVLLGVLNLALGILFSFRVLLAPAQQGIGFQIFGGLTPINDYIGMAMGFAGAGISLMTGQMVFLEFLRIKITALLPIGIVLRSFPFSRSAGGALIALVLGLYFMYPLLLTLGKQVAERDLSGYDISAAMNKPPVSEPAGPDNPGAVDTMNLGGFVTNWIDIFAYKVFVIGIFMPVLFLTITFAFIKDLATFLGGEIDVSSLMRLI